MAGRGKPEFIVQTVRTWEVRRMTPASISLWYTVITASHLLHIGSSNKALPM